VIGIPRFSRIIAREKAHAVGDEKGLKSLERNTKTWTFRGMYTIGEIEMSAMPEKEE